MMRVVNSLLQQVLADGFRIALLECQADRATHAVALQARLFDGGCEKDSVRHVLQDRADLLPTERLSKILYQVAAPPYILAVYGNAWLSVLHSLFAERISLFRILDLRATAIALHPELSARATMTDLLKSLAAPFREYDSPLLPDEAEQLLWAVIAEADRRAMTLTDLLLCAESARRYPDFSRCTFDADALARAPAAPGVYAMYDRRGRLLYVGKSANLRRRMTEYFTASVRLPDKIARIREHIHHLAYQTVGSELEALLLENRMITSQKPIINVQRTVAEGRSRYGEPFLPVVVVVRSARADRADAFVFGGQRHAYQFIFLPAARRMPHSFSRLLAHFLGDSAPPKLNRALRDWGTVGAEICRRYFGRHRPRLHWRELGPRLLQPDGWNIMQEMGRTALSEDASAAEFRDE